MMPSGQLMATSARGIDERRYLDRSEDARDDVKEQNTKPQCSTQSKNMPRNKSIFSNSTCPNKISQIMKATNIILNFSLFLVYSHFLLDTNRQYVYMIIYTIYLVTYGRNNCLYKTLIC